MRALRDRRIKATMVPMTMPASHGDDREVNGPGQAGDDVRGRQVIGDDAPLQALGREEEMDEHGQEHEDDDADQPSSPRPYSA